MQLFPLVVKELHPGFLFKFKNREIHFLINKKKDFVYRSNISIIVSVRCSIKSFASSSSRSVVSVFQEKIFKYFSLVSFQFCLESKYRKSTDYIVFEIFYLVFIIDCAWSFASYVAFKA
jgi:hypothetical protein